MAFYKMETQWEKAFVNGKFKVIFDFSLTVNFYKTSQNQIKYKNNFCFLASANLQQEYN